MAFGWGKAAISNYHLSLKNPELTTPPPSTDESADAYQQVQNADDEHKGSLTHELIAGAAAFIAFKHFEDKQRSEG